MSDGASNREGPRGPRESIERRAWSNERQWRVVAIGIVALMVLILGIWLGGRFFGKQEASAAAASPPGTFRPTAQQLKNQGRLVQAHGFFVQVGQHLTASSWIAQTGDRARRGIAMMVAGDWCDPNGDGSDLAA